MISIMLRPDVTVELRRFAKQLRRSPTEIESLLWRELRANRLGGWRFKRQVALGPYVVDFVCLTALLIVETDGPIHDHPDQKLRDAERDRALSARGFRILRFSGDHIRSNLASVIAEIKRALDGPLPTSD